jgi:hypothetical protein
MSPIATKSLEQETFNPPQLASRWGVKPDTVREFIRSGELKAFNVASPGAVRPRFRIPLEEVKRFEKAREATPPSKATRRSRKRDQGPAKDYFQQ